MGKRPFVAAVLSLLVPGLGQIYGGKGERGARILFAAIVIGNLNAVWLSVHGIAASAGDAFWAVMLPRILHDVFAVWAVAFWAWAITDAYRQARPHSQE